jgi:predicted ester cyclase
LGTSFSRIASWGLLWWSALALAFGGACIVVLVLALVLISTGLLGPGMDDPLYYLGENPLWLRVLNAVVLPAYALGPLLTAVGMGVGFRSLVEERSRKRRAVAGALLAASSPVVFGLLLASETSFYYGMFTIPGLLRAWYTVGWPLGIVVLGTVAAGVRGLGRWRFLPLSLGGLALATASLELLPVLLPPPAYPGDENRLQKALDALFPLWLAVQFALGLGCALLARPLLRAPERERRFVEGENLALARRLYGKAWVEGDPEVLDELVAPGCEDRYGNGVGPASLKRSVAGLRKTFPDLRFTVEAQEARGDEVVTRWTASGTDRGGVLWYPPTGRSASFGGRFVDRFEDGKLVEHRGEADTATLLEQIGQQQQN